MCSLFDVVRYITDIHLQNEIYEVSITLVFSMQILKIEQALLYNASKINICNLWASQKNLLFQDLEPSLSPPLTTAPCLGEAQQQTTSVTNTHTLKKCVVATLVPQ